VNFKTSAALASAGASPALALALALAPSSSSSPLRAFGSPAKDDDGLSCAFAREFPSALLASLARTSRVTGLWTLVCPRARDGAATARRMRGAKDAFFVPHRSKGDGFDER